MKKLLTGTVLFLFAITTGWSQTAAHKWSLFITPDSKKHSLDSVVAAWKKDGIDLQFTKLEYNKTGKLIKIQGTVNYTSKGNPVSGKFESENLESYEIKLTDKPTIHLKGK